MKYYPKNQLHFKDGMLIDHSSGEVVVVDPIVVQQANNLETKLQKARYLAAQPKVNPAPTLVGFERESLHEIKRFEVDTPVSDKRTEETVAFLREVDEMATIEKMNKMMDSLRDLILFARDENVLSMGIISSTRFDTPLLGDPLTWTEDTIAKAVAEIEGYEIVELEDDGQVAEPENDGESE